MFFTKLNLKIKFKYSFQQHSLNMNYFRTKQSVYMKQVNYFYCNKKNDPQNVQKS